LKIQKSDSFPLKATKVLTRIPMGVVTLGKSEIYYATDRHMSSWLGADEPSLVMAWGAPSQVWSDGAGGRILIYSGSRTFVSPGYASTSTTGYASGYTYGNRAYAQGYSQSYTTYTPPQAHSYPTFRSFRLGSDGRIVSYSWKGL
jgi:hypothetical protein